jgi:2-aminomuconate deaminase
MPPTPTVPPDPRNGVAFHLTERARTLAGYPHMRAANGMLYLSGISARRLDDTVVGVTHHEDGTVTTDIRAQTRAVIENIRAVLQAAGADLDCLVTLTAYLVDMQEYAAYNEVYNEYFSAQTGPSRTTVEVCSLPGPHLRIEMTTMAVDPRGGERF